MGEGEGDGGGEERRKRKHRHHHHHRRRRRRHHSKEEEPREREDPEERGAIRRGPQIGPAFPGPSGPPAAKRGPVIGPALPPSLSPPGPAPRPPPPVDELLDDDEEDFVGPMQVAPADGARIGTASEEIERILRSARACDSHQILGVPADAPTKTVVKRYLKLSLKLHPDKCQLPNAAKAFTILNKAKTDLLDSSGTSADDAKLWEMAVAEARRRQQSEDWQSIRATGKIRPQPSQPLQREEWLTNRDLPTSAPKPQQRNVTRFTR